MMHRNRNRNLIHNEAGMTLVELMVALAIGLFLMIGAIQVYNQSRQAFVINESIARVQETAQFANGTRSRRICAWRATGAGTAAVRPSTAARWSAI
jgi:type IV pilus assembly protein PilW